MEEVCTALKSQKGNDLLKLRGYVFSKNRKREDLWYWHCTERNSGKCSAFVCTILLGGKHIIRSESPHNHAPRPEKSDVADAKEKIKERARTTNEAPSQIIQTIVAEIPIASAPYMPNRDALRRTVKRMRREDMTAQPTTLEEFEVPITLREIDGVKFLGRDSVLGNERILLFSTKENMQKLQEAPYWIMDGTFKTCPTLFRQIYTIHAMVGTDTTTQRFVPLVYGLLSSKTEECYSKFLADLQDYAADYNIEFAPQYIITDFEMAAINAAKREFGSSTHKCCWFNLGKNLWRNIQSCGLAAEYGENSDLALRLRHLQALAFLPPDEIPRAFEAVKEILPANTEPVVQWFEDNYVLGRIRQSRRNPPTRTPPLFPPTIWSVSENNLLGFPRTQNKLEGWHRRWNTIVGNRKLGVYMLIKEMVKEQKTTLSEIDKVPNSPAKKVRKREKRQSVLALPGKIT